MQYGEASSLYIGLDIGRILSKGNGFSSKKQQAEEQSEPLIGAEGVMFFSQASTRSEKSTDSSLWYNSGGFIVEGPTGGLRYTGLVSKELEVTTKPFPALAKYRSYRLLFPSIQRMTQWIY